MPSLYAKNRFIGMFLREVRSEPAARMAAPDSAFRCFDDQERIGHLTCGQYFRPAANGLSQCRKPAFKLLGFGPFSGPTPGAIGNLDLGFTQLADDLLRLKSLLGHPEIPHL